MHKKVTYYTYVHVCTCIYSDHNTHMQVHTIDCHTVTKGTYVPVCDFSWVRRHSWEPPLASSRWLHTAVACSSGSVCDSSHHTLNTHTHTHTHTNTRTHTQGEKKEEEEGEGTSEWSKYMYTVYTCIKLYVMWVNINNVVSLETNVYILYWVLSVQWSSVMFHWPVHLAPWRNIPCIIWPHMSQKEGPRKLWTLNRWGMSILNLSRRNYV